MPSKTREEKTKNCLKCAEVLQICYSDLCLGVPLIAHVLVLTYLTATVTVFAAAAAVAVEAEILIIA